MGNKKKPLKYLLSITYFINTGLTAGAIAYFGYNMVKNQDDYGSFQFSRLNNTDIEQLNELLNTQLNATNFDELLTEAISTTISWAKYGDWGLYTAMIAV